MELIDGALRYSANDLIAFVNCRHLVAQNLAAAHGVRSIPSPSSRFLESLLELGKKHEAAYIEHLRGAGFHLTCIDGVGITNEAVRLTKHAMQEGVQFIHQGALANGDWAGRVDVLRRIERKSKFGDWSYEVVDVKLASQTKANTILQLCLYSDLLSSTQESEPLKMHVVTPSTEYTLQPYRVSDFSAYYRRIVREFMKNMKEGFFEDTYPEPVQHCDTCNYFAECNRTRRVDDHLSFVAGITRLQIEELKNCGVNTLKKLASMPLPLSWKPTRGTNEGFLRVREQARVQFESRDQEMPKFELLPLRNEFGLACLPEPCSGDVFFDIEGDRFVEGGGIEYLFGYLTSLESSDMDYHSAWAFNREEEKKIFEMFIDFVMKNWRENPAMHIYHFAHYEPSALKRLMGRYATREDEIDQMLRAGLFVDLHRIVKHSIRAGVESYSLKMLEPLYGFTRTASISQADETIAIVRNRLESGSAQYVTENNMVTVAKYNQDDCESLFELRCWLETQRMLLVNEGRDIPRPSMKEAAPSEKISDWQKLRDELIEQLTQGIPADVTIRDEEQQSKWLLANLLDWYRREEKSMWWEYFHLLDLSEEELLDERAGLSGLEYIDNEICSDGKQIYIYRYPKQETDVRPKDSVCTLTGKKYGKVEKISHEERKVRIVVPKGGTVTHPNAVIVHNYISSNVLQNSLTRIAKNIASHGVTATGKYIVAKDLLLRRKPDIGDIRVLLSGRESTIDVARKLCERMTSGVLPIQGPPGSGKTFTGAHMICEYVRQGKRVGIVANSHKVIENLLVKAIEISECMEIELRCCKKVSRGEETGTAIFDEIDDNGVMTEKLSNNVNIGAATAWFWAREEAENLVDVLFVDEAAQMSLANVLAVSHAAKIMVLLGDPQQLAQPIKGCHPDGTDVSAMRHIIGDAQTISMDAGLFLNETWRLHPKICDYTSEMFYDNRLQTRENLSNQQVCECGVVAGSGLQCCTVEHQGNVSSSSEEAEIVASLVTSILDNQTKWIDKDGAEHKITSEDILIITPYNAQVSTILNILPGARVGTVDKFQGQEAPIAIYSTATSKGDIAPRGLEFLYNLNRLNVATSRSKCVSILVCSPLIFEAECRTPHQIRLVNAFCRYLEMAEEM